MQLSHISNWARRGRRWTTWKSPWLRDSRRKRCEIYQTLITSATSRVSRSYFLSVESVSTRRILTNESLSAAPFLSRGCGDGGRADPVAIAIFLRPLLPSGRQETSLL